MRSAAGLTYNNSLPSTDVHQTRSLAELSRLASNFSLAGCSALGSLPPPMSLPIKHLRNHKLRTEMSISIYEVECLDTTPGLSIVSIEIIAS